VQKNYNFIRIITIIWISLLLFAPSVYDPSVYAQMKAISEDDLAKIEGQQGINIATNLTVNITASSLGFYNDSSLTKDGIQFSSLAINNGTAGNGFTMGTTLVADVGTDSGGQTWVNISGLSFPSNASGIGISTTGGIKFMDNGGAWTTLGNPTITGLFIGQSVSSVSGTNITPAYTKGATTPFVRISSHGDGTQGVNLMAETGLYIDKVVFAYNTSGTATKVNISGIYLAGLGNSTASGTPSSWAPLTGNALTGLSASNPATIDVGTTGGNTSIRLNLPMSATIRIKDFSFDPARSWGPIAIDNMTMYTMKATIINLP
jgi:hypothetical protein